MVFALAMTKKPKKSILMMNEIGMPVIDPDQRERIQPEEDVSVEFELKLQYLDGSPKFSQDISRD